jgi:hypothetical protein
MLFRLWDRLPPLKKKLSVFLVVLSADLTSAFIATNVVQALRSNASSPQMLEKWNRPMPPTIHHHCPTNTQETARMNSAAASVLKKYQCGRWKPALPATLSLSALDSPPPFLFIVPSLISCLSICSLCFGSKSARRCASSAIWLDCVFCSLKPIPY